MSHRGDRSGATREVDIKLQRVDSGVVRTHSSQNMRRTAAGDTTANGTRGRMRGSGEAGRYHSVHMATVEDGAQPSGGGVRRAGSHHAVGQDTDIRRELGEHFQSEAGRSFARLEERGHLRGLRPPRQAKEEYLDTNAYISPTKSVANINDRLRERKIEFQDLKDQFKRELKVEFPTASEERLQAMAQRLCNEKLLADEKMTRFPVQHESFRPNLALTTQDRRYKEYHHPGTWSLNETEKRFCWSCCLNFGQGSRGCEYKIVNPDAWCTLGYERRPGMAAAGKA